MEEEKLYKLFCETINYDNIHHIIAMDICENYYNISNDGEEGHIIGKNGETLIEVPFLNLRSELLWNDETKKMTTFILNLHRKYEFVEKKKNKVIYKILD